MHLLGLPSHPLSPVSYRWGPSYAMTSAWNVSTATGGKQPGWGVQGYKRNTFLRSLIVNVRFCIWWHCLTRSWCTVHGRLEGEGSAQHDATSGTVDLVPRPPGQRLRAYIDFRDAYSRCADLPAFLHPPAAYQLSKVRGMTLIRSYPSPTELDWLTNIKTLTFQYRACKERNLWKGRRWSFLWSSPTSRPSTNLTKSSWNKARTGKNLCLKHCRDIVELVELRNESAKLWGLWWFHSLVAWRLSVLWLGPKAPQCTYMHMV